jgi:hypothetical protein
LETAVLVLNVLAFVIIGLELGRIIAARPGDLGRRTWLGAAVLDPVIGVRLLWTFAGALRLNGASVAALRMQLFLLVPQFPDKFRYPVSCHLIQHPLRQRLQMLDLLVEFAALIAHG